MAEPVHPGPSSISDFWGDVTPDQECYDGGCCEVLEQVANDRAVGHH